MNFTTNLNPTDAENFQRAIEIYTTNPPHEKLLDLIKTGTVVEKQTSILLLDTLNSEKDAEILISNLTGQDGKVREAVSFKLKELLKKDGMLKFFNNPDYAFILFDGALDINGNICRNSINIMKNFKTNADFVEKLIPKLTDTINKLLDKIKDFDIQEGKYKVNKEIFKLYWAMEVMYEFIDFIELNDIKCILQLTSKVEDYTIREKTAKILSKNFADEQLSKLKQTLRRDKNYYVRRF